MATNTTNLGLRKPAKADYVNVVTDIDDNMDLIDSAVNNVEKAVAVIANGNTHVAVSAGEYLYIRNHLSLEEGLYMATEAIAQNGTLSSSNTTAITRGIGGQVTALNNKVGSVSRCGKVQTSTSNGQASFQMENGTHGFVAIGGNAPITVGMTNGGSLYNSAMPSGYTISQSGTTVTITKTSSVSTSVAVSYLFIS
jgi:hypothetical protein